MQSILMQTIIIHNNITARPWGLPGLAASARASQDDDDDDDEDDEADEDDWMIGWLDDWMIDDDDDDFDILLKP